MAIISVLIGGITGFFSFLLGLFVFEMSFLQALGLYICIGSGLTLSLIATALSWRSIAIRSGRVLRGNPGHFRSQASAPQPEARRFTG